MHKKTRGVQTGKKEMAKTSALDTLHFHMKIAAHVFVFVTCHVFAGVDQAFPERRSAQQ